MIALLAVWGFAASAPIWLALVWHVVTVAREVARCIRDARYSPASWEVPPMAIVACLWTRRAQWGAISVYTALERAVAPMRAIRRAYPGPWCTI